MPESERSRKPERPEAMDSWRPGEPPHAPASDDPSTIRTGAEGSSSYRRRAALADLPEPGGRIGPFVLEEAIGVGGMGAVFRALDQRLDRQVALKTLPTEQANDSEVVQRFYQEARAAARLDHENIARVYEIGHDAPHHYIAFEYIDGTTIRHRVEAHGPLPVAEAINYTLQIASALVHAVDRGVVHRDIKPSNIIVTRHGRAKLVDMGLARRFERGAACDDGLTQSNMTLGTFDYISPEQARDPRDVDVRSDLYSLGCTLFYMLAGRPPFPDGTVLQKLLQHQEEPAPDIRSINPQVPADLASMLLKLMAKAPDRRYQTPEQLVRELLTLAGTLGLRSVSPEGLVWMSAAAPPAWERHLVWGVPVMGFVLVVLVLIWWSPPAEPNSPLDAGTSGPQVPPLTVSATRAESPRLPTVGTADTPQADPPSHAQPTQVDSKPPAAPPREVLVRVGDDLAELLADAVSGTTLVLADAGPFDLGPQAAGASASLPKTRDLTLRAAPGIRPVLRASRVSEGGTGERALLRLGPGRVLLDGLEFLLEPDGRDETLLAVEAGGTDLTIQRCWFRRKGPGAAPDRIVHARFRGPVPSTSADGRPAPVVIRDTFFDEARTAVSVQGRADLQFRDCLFAPARTIVWIDNSDLNQRVRVGLTHVSILAGEGPVFRLTGADATIRLDDSVIAPPFETGATLVAADTPERVDWLGRGNRYAGVTTYFQPTRVTPDAPAIQRFDAWAEGALALREVDSKSNDTPVWEQADPVRALARPDPAAAFILSSAERFTPRVGARRGPLGALAETGEKTALALGPKPRTPAPKPGTTAPEVDRTEPRDGAPKGPGSSAISPVPEPAPATVPNDQAIEPPAPMEVAPGPMARPGDMPPPMERPAETARDEEIAKPDVEGTTVSGGSPSTNPAPPTTEAASVLRTADQVIRALRDRGAYGATLVLARGAEIDLAASVIKSKGRVVLRAADDAGSRRPRLRFRPETQDGKRLPGLPALFRLEAGVLELHNLDILLAENDAPPAGRWAAFGVSAGTELTLVGCTVTVEGPQSRAAAVAVLASYDVPEEGLITPDSSAASVRCNDSLLRSGGDLVNVAAGRRLELGLSNVVVATGGCLVHGHALARGQTPEPVRVTLRQATARLAGGLVQLESSPGEPELPLAEVTARDTILATTDLGAPLFRVDGQAELDGLQDRIRWEGHAVAYHNIVLYRRDQTSQPGNLPRRFDRPSWEVAVGRNDDDAFHGELKFRTPWDPDRPAWTVTPDDVRLDPRSPAAGSSGADLARVPEPSGVKVGD
jgi:serine/threonine-protein kinase